MVFRPNNSLLLASKKIKSTHKSLELTTATCLPAVIHYTPSESYDVIKDYDQTSATTQHSINQPCSESVKLDIKWVDERVENRVAASCKKAYW